MSSNHQVTTKKSKLWPSNTFNIKSSISPLIPGKFGPKNEIYFHCYETLYSKQVKFLNLKDDSWKRQILGRFGLKIGMWFNFIPNVNYEYGTWNWLSWSKIIDLGKIGPNTEICSNFYEIWHSQQIKHANNECNTHHCLESWRDYWLRMIIGSELL